MSFGKGSTNCVEYADAALNAEINAYGATHSFQEYYEIHYGYFTDCMLSNGNVQLPVFL